MANQLVDNHGHALRGAASIDDVERAIGGELASTRQSFNDRVIAERRGEGLLEAAILAKLRPSRTASTDKPKGIAPRVIATDDAPIGAGEVGSSYRDAPPRAELPLKPSRLAPPPSTLARMRNQLLFAAGWIVLVIRLAAAVRSNGVSTLAATQGVLGTLAVLPLILGALFFVLPRR
jgi:hypothetical protein